MTTCSSAALATSPEQTLLQMFDCLDERRYDELLMLMTDDAIWHRQGQSLRGHAQILAALEQRSPTQRIRHLVTNLLVRPVGPNEVHCRHYMTALRHDDGRVHTGPLQIGGPFRMSVVSSRLVNHGAGWRVAEQAIVTEFEFTAPA